MASRDWGKWHNFGRPTGPDEPIRNERELREWRFRRWLAHYTKKTVVFVLPGNNHHVWTDLYCVECSVRIDVRDHLGECSVGAKEKSE